MKQLVWSIALTLLWLWLASILSNPVSMFAAYLWAALNAATAAMRTNRLVHSYYLFLEKPGCFGSNPGAQQQAENDCLTCHYQNACLYRLHL